MTAFLYPKLKHARALLPPQFKRHGSYKRYLQKEFSRTCVYCRAVDTNAVDVVFGVDHYRPQSLFESLKTEYRNLFYCCSACNSRKNDYWPAPGFEKTLFVPNPCDHAMFKHLRFRDGEVNALSDAGEFSRKLLDLNDAATVAHRRSVIHTIEVLQDKLVEHDEVEQLIEAKLKKGVLGAAEASAMQAEIARLRAKTKDALARQLGTLPLPVIKAKRSAATTSGG